MWNYRIVERDGMFGIYEVYYDDQGKPEMVAAEPEFGLRDQPEELLQALDHMRLAFDATSLKFEDFKQPDEGDII